jgi:SHAQKYF class myb-like DNA-binding protein
MKSTSALKNIQTVYPQESPKISSVTGPLLPNNFSFSNYSGSSSLHFIPSTNEGQKQTNLRPQLTSDATPPSAESLKILSSHSDDLTTLEALGSNSGRWTEEEHQKFIEAIEKYGNAWKLICKHIGTRSPAQIRSHAQKYYQRLRQIAIEKAKSDPLKKGNIFAVTKEFWNCTSTLANAGIRDPSEGRNNKRKRIQEISNNNENKKVIEKKPEAKKANKSEEVMNTDLKVLAPIPVYPAFLRLPVNLPTSQSFSAWKACLGQMLGGYPFFNPQMGLEKSFTNSKNY